MADQQGYGKKQPPIPKPTAKPPAAEAQPANLPGLYHVTDRKQALDLEKQGFHLVDYGGGQYYDPDQGNPGSHLYHVNSPAEALALQQAGFKMTDQNGGQYFQSFGRPAPTNVNAAPNSGMTSSQQNAWAQLQQTLQSYGFSGADLTALVAWAKGEIIKGNSAAQIGLDLMQTPQFAKRFPAIIARQKAGLPPISVAEYLANERSYDQLERAAGIPPNFANYDALIAADVSPAEYSDRINKGYLAVAQSDPTVIRAFQDFYGVTQGELAAYFIDPKNAAPLLEQKAIAAQIGGAAAMAGFHNGVQTNTTATAPSFTGIQGLGGVGGLTTLSGITPTTHPAAGKATTPLTPNGATIGIEGISADEAMRLTQMGVTQAQAQQGFQKLSQESQLYNPLPGQGQIGHPLSTDALLNAQFGSDGQTALQLQIQADFEKGLTNQGTGVGETSSGATGVGAVQR